MEIISVFAIISIIIFIGFFAEIIFKKFNIPDVIILIGVGILIGTVLKWTNVESFGEGSKLFTTFALVFILFQGALSIDFKTLFKSLSSTVKLTTINFLFTIIIIVIISMIMGYDLKTALLFAMILGGTSSAVVIPLVNNVNIKNKYGLVLTLESALSDVLCIIGTVTILEIIETGKIEASGIFRSVLSSFSLALIVGILAGFIWIILLNKSENLSKSYMLTIAFVIGLYAFVESSFVQASGAIAALAFGLMLGNSKTILNLNQNKKSNDKKEEDEIIIKNVLSPSAKNFYSEISFFVKTFFFVYLGIMMDFSNPKIFLYGAILTIGIFLVRPFAVKLVFRKENIEDNERTLLEILIPKGLAAAVLGGIAMQSGAFGTQGTQAISLILSVVLLSILLTSILVFLTQKNWFKGFLPFLKNNN